jgi:hypothetical protein
MRSTVEYLSWRGSPPSLGSKTRDGTCKYSGYQEILALGDEMPGVTDELAFLIDRSFDHALSSVAPNGPMSPFVMTMTGEGQVGLQRVVADRVEDGVVHARELLADRTDVTHAVLAYEAWVEHGGQRVDGVIVEAFEGHLDSSIVLAQPFVWKGLFKKTAFPLAEPRMIQTSEPLLRSV